VHRSLVAVLLFSASCGPASNPGITNAVGALAQVVMTSAISAAARSRDPSVTRARPAPSFDDPRAVRAVVACGDGRSYRMLRPVGSTYWNCYFEELPDGRRFDCPADGTTTAPPELIAWCKTATR
jgi:hypothetical protein